MSLLVFFSFLKENNSRTFMSRFFVAELSFEWCLTSPFCATCARRGSPYIACLVSGSLLCSDYCHSTPTHQRLEVCGGGAGVNAFRTGNLFLGTSYLK